MAQALDAVTQRRLLPSIQGLRGIAVLLVVLYHADLPIGAGYVGVDVFFVISGFVITRLVLNRSEHTDRLGLKSFWAARVRRLAPALAVAIVLTLVLSVPFSSPAGSQSDVATTGIASIFWVANAVLAVLTLGYFADGAEQNPLLHMWSLAVEEQFYLVFPLIVVAMLWWVRRRGTDRFRLFAVVIAALSVLSLVVSIALTYADLSFGVGPTLAFYSPMSRAWEFGAGALVALAVHRHAVRGVPALAAGGFVLLALGLVVIDDPSVFPGYIAVVPVLGSAMLCAAASSDSERVLSVRPLVWIGDRSYGWYLFHWPLIVLIGTYVTDAVAAVLGLLIADWSLRALEDPIRHRRKLGGLSAPKLWLTCSAPVVVGCVLLMFAGSQYWWNGSIEQFAHGVSRGEHPVQAECQSVTPLTERDMSACTFGPDDDPDPMILIGDSNGGMYADMVAEAAEQTGRRVTIATIPSCQVDDVAMSRKGVRPNFLIDCLGRYDDTLAWLAEQPPSTVLVASGAATPDLTNFVLLDADGTVYEDGEAKQAALQASLERSYDAIGRLGHQVVAIELAPQWKEPDNTGWTPRDCSVIDVLIDAETCERHLDRASMDAQQQRTLAAARSAADATGTQVLAVRDVLCPDDMCGTTIDGTWIYSDSAHLTPVGANLLADRFVDLMSQR